MKKPIITICLLILATGCATNKIDYEGHKRVAKYRYESKKVDFECKEGGSEVCGFIYKDLIMEYGRIKKELCDPNKSTDEQCADIWLKMAESRYKQRYPFANFPLSVHLCNANPVDCNSSSPKGLKNFETLLITSHNDTLDKKLIEENSRIDSVAENDANQRKLQFGAFLSGFGKSMSNNSQQQAYQAPIQKRTNCRSYKMGNEVHTDCTGN